MTKLTIIDEGSDDKNILRIDDAGIIDYSMKNETDYYWPFHTTLQGAVSDGSLVNLVTNFLRVGVKPEACKKSVDEVLDEYAVSKARSIIYRMKADYVVLSKNSIRELQSRDTGDTIYATYVATFYALANKK